MDPLMAALRRLRLHLLVSQWTRALVSALILTTALACGWLLLVRLFPKLGAVEPVSAGLVAAGIVLATLYTLWKRPSVLKAAIEADRRLGLQERITSSLQLADAEGAMVAALHDDARTQLAKLDYTREFPFATPRSVRWLAIPVLLFLTGYLLLPEFDLFSQRAREAEAKKKEEAVRVEANRLVEAIKPLRELGLENDADLNAIAGEIQRISDQLKAGELDEKQAFAKLTNLANQLSDQQKKLEAKAPTPKIGSELSKLDLSKELAENIQKGDFGKAQEKAQELAEKALSETATPEEKQKASEELSKLANMLSETNPELAKALSQLAAAMKMNNPGELKKAAEAMKLSLDQLKELMAQMQKLSECQGKLAQCKNKLYCSQCKGICTGNCQSDKYGLGLRGKGKGQGNRIGELPDVKTSTEEKLAPGDVVQGKVLATIMQRAAPSDNPQATVDYSAQALVQIQQQNEEALTKEEIPPGAKEFVRQYFGSLEPERDMNQQQVPVETPAAK